MKQIQKIKSYPQFPSLCVNCGVYCRVSTGMAEQLHSLSSQVSHFVQMFSRHSDLKLIDIYIDICSGEKNDRSEFYRMLSDVENGKIQCVFTKSISRFGRNTEEAVTAIRKFHEHNAQLIFEEEHLDTNKDGAEFIITVLSAYAQADNQSRRENQLWAINNKVKDGTSELYYRKCYGYKKDEAGNLRIDYTEAEVVLMIFENYLNGMSIVGLQKFLRDKGISTATGKAIWSKKAIEHILTNEKYTGSVIVMKTKHTDRHKVEINNGEKYLATDIHPAIIGKEMFDAVQAERERRSNVVEDENGKHRRTEKYSSKRS